GDDERGELRHEGECRARPGGRAHRERSGATLPAGATRTTPAPDLCPQRSKLYGGGSYRARGAKSLSGKRLRRHDEGDEIVGQLRGPAGPVAARPLDRARNQRAHVAVICIEVDKDHV